MSNENYAKCEGKSLTDLHNGLWAVYTSTEHGYCREGTFKDMVEKFANDDFYNLHLVAKSYLDYVVWFHGMPSSR